MSKRGKTIVLSGATKGLGRAMAQGLAAQGHTIVGCGRSQPGIDQLRHLLPGDHRFDMVDVANQKEVSDWAGHCLKQFGPPDVLINNAAIMNEPAPAWEVSEAEWRQVMEINVLGTAWMLRAWLPAMIEAKKGVIVNFSSGWGRSTSPDVAPYCASKFAIEGMTKALAQEIPMGMAAVALNPGVINTDMLATCFGNGAGSYPTPEQWARKAVPFILAIGAEQNGKSLSVS